MSDPRHDDRLAAHLFAHLEKHGTDEVIREIAHEVRSGRISLRDVMSSGVYSAAFDTGVTDFIDWRRRQDPQELAQEAEHYAVRVAELNQQNDRPD